MFIFPLPNIESAEANPSSSQNRNAQQFSLQSNLRVIYVSPPATVSWKRILISLYLQESIMLVRETIQRICILKFGIIRDQCKTSYPENNLN